MPLPGRTVLGHTGSTAAWPHRPSRPALELIAQARRSLHEARHQEYPADRYAAAHLAALRGAAAVLAARPPAAGTRRRRRPASAWVLLTAIAPELAGWAGTFAAGAGKRAAAEAGSLAAVTHAEAEGLIDDVETFLTIVEATLRDGAAAAPASRVG